MILPVLAANDLIAVATYATAELPGFPDSQPIGDHAGRSSPVPFPAVFTAAASSDALQGGCVPVLIRLPYPAAGASTVLRSTGGKELVRVEALAVD